MEFFKKLFGGRPSSPAQVGKERLVSILVTERLGITPEMMSNLRVEMVALIRKYMDIDESNIDINLDRGGRDMSLKANVPVLSVRRGTAAAQDERGAQEQARAHG